MIKDTTGIIQAGASATAANNFVLDASAANGTAKLYSGNAGTPVNTVLTVSATGAVTIPVSVTSPNVPKAFCIFDGTLTGTNAPITGFNVASVTHLAVGSYQINFATAFADNNYVTTVTADAATAAILGASYYSASTAAAVNVRTYTGAGALGDTSRVSLVIYKVGA